MEDSSLPTPEIENPTYSIISIPASKLTHAYIPMLFSRWLRSLRFGNSNLRKVSSSHYYKHYHVYIEKLLAKPDSIVRLAVLSDDHDVVLGFSVCREDVLDYVHVHTDYRKIGIATQLVPKDITAFTHITLIGIDIWQSKPKNRHLKYEPYA